MKILPLILSTQQPHIPDELTRPSSPQNKSHQEASSEYLNHPSPKLPHKKNKNCRKELESRQEETIPGKDVYIFLFFYVS